MFDSKVDVYSFGVLLWEMRTKEEPFRTRIQQLIKKEKLVKLIKEVGRGKEKLKMKVESLSFPSKDKEYLELMKQCLSFDADARPSFSKVNPDLQRLVGNQSVNSPKLLALQSTKSRLSFVKRNTDFDMKCEKVLSFPYKIGKHHSIFYTNHSHFVCQEEKITLFKRNSVAQVLNIPSNDIDNPILLDRRHNKMVWVASKTQLIALQEKRDQWKKVLSIKQASSSKKSVDSLSINALCQLRSPPHEIVFSNLKGDVFVHNPTNTIQSKVLGKKPSRSIGDNIDKDSKIRAMCTSHAKGLQVSCPNYFLFCIKFFILGGKKVEKLFIAQGRTINCIDLETSSSSKGSTSKNSRKERILAKHTFDTEHTSAIEHMLPVDIGDKQSLWTCSRNELIVWQIEEKALVKKKIIALSRVTKMVYTYGKGATSRFIWTVQYSTTSAIHRELLVWDAFAVLEKKDNAPIHRDITSINTICKDGASLFTSTEECIHRWSARNTPTIQEEESLREPSFNLNESPFIEKEEDDPQMDATVIEDDDL